MSENEKETGASAPRKRPSGLGRGLNALFGDAAVEAPVLATPGGAAKAAPVAAGDSVQHVSVGSIRPLPNQPRRHFDEAAIVVQKVESTVPGIETSVQETQPGHRFQVRLVLKPEMAKGAVSGVVKVYTTSDKKPVFEIPVKGTVL